jgi:hypothetical protein
VKVLEPITLTKGEVPSVGTGSLYVTSYPSGATILINGTDVGTTDGIVTNVPAGEQNLTLAKEGYQPKTVMVNVPDGGVKVLEPITLTKGTPAGPEVTSPALVSTIPAADDHGAETV